MNEYEKLKLFIYECGMTEENVNYTIDLMETCNVIDQSLLIESVKNFVYIVEKKTEESYRKKEFKKYHNPKISIVTSIYNREKFIIIIILNSNKNHYKIYN